MSMTYMYMRITRFLNSAIKGYCSNYAEISINCWQGALLTFIESSFGGICFFLSLYFVNELQINIAISGLLISFYGFGKFVGGFVGGRLSDKMSPSFVALFSLVVEAIAFLSLIKINNIKLLMLILFVLGFSTYTFITSNNICVLKNCNNNDKDRLKAINILTIASNLGIGLSGVIVALIAPYGFENIFALSGILLLITAVWTALYGERQYRLVSDYVSKKTETKGQYVSEGAQGQNSKIILLILVCLFFAGLIVWQRTATYLIYIQHLFPGLGYKAIAFLFILNPIMIVLFQSPLVGLFKNANKLVMTGVGILLMAFGMYALTFATYYSFAVMACIIYTIGEMLFFAMAQLVIYQRSSENKKGHNIGLYRTVYASSAIIGPAMAGFIYHNFGANMVWYLMGAAGLICFIACSYCQRYC